MMTRKDSVMSVSASKAAKIKLVKVFKGDHYSSCLMSFSATEVNQNLNQSIHLNMRKQNLRTAIYKLLTGLGQIKELLKF